MDQIKNRLLGMSPAQRKLFLLRLHQQGLAPSFFPILPLSHSVSRLPLSSAQERIWLQLQMRPNTPSYNCPVGFYLKGTLNKILLDKSINEIIKRHDSLRTTIVVTQGQPQQIVLSQLKLQTEFTSMTFLSQGEQKAIISHFLTQHARRIFNLSNGPLIRVTLIKLNSDEHFLLLNFHHIIFDGWSEGIFMNELSQFYTSLSLSSFSPLPDISIQYGDFALWQKQIYEVNGESEEAFWRIQLHGTSEKLQLPYDRQAFGHTNDNGEQCVLSIPSELTESLEYVRASECLGTTSNMLFLTGFIALLFLYGNQAEVLIGTPLVGRASSLLENLIGCFSQIVPLRIFLSETLTFRSLLQQVRLTMLAISEHQETFSEKLDLGAPRVVFGFEPDIYTIKHSIANLYTEQVDVSTASARNDLRIMLVRKTHSLSVIAEYNTDLFNRYKINKLLEDYQKILQRFAYAPNERISL